LQYFKPSTSFQNYSVELFTSIAQMEALLSEEMAHRLTWGNTLIGMVVRAKTLLVIWLKRSAIE
jgi:hypothetical protein